MNAPTSYNPSLPTNIYNQYKMDMIVAYYIQQRLEEDRKRMNKRPYISPKRNIVCSQCGQQYYWCICKSKEDVNK